MAKNLLAKITPNKADLRETLVNIGASWIFAKGANIISNSFFRYNLNPFNSDNHLIAGISLGTLGCRKIGNGYKEFGITLGITTAISIGWELFENLYVFKADYSALLNADTLSDMAMVSAGCVLGFVWEGYKEHRKRNKEKWVL